MWLRRIASRRAASTRGVTGAPRRAAARRPARRWARGSPGRAAPRRRTGDRRAGRRRPACRCRTPGRRLRGRTASVRARRSRWRRPRSAVDQAPARRRAAPGSASPAPSTRVVAEERRRPTSRQRRRGVSAGSSAFLPAVEGAPRARLLAAACRSPRSKPSASKRSAGAGGEVLDEVARHAVGVVELERLVAGDHAARRAACCSIISSSRGRPPAEHRVEALFLAADHLHDGVAAGHQLGIGGAHLGDQHVDQPVEERSLEAEPAAVAHRPAHDLAQHVAAPLVRRHDAVGDQEGHRAHVVGDHPHRDVGRVHRAAVAALGQPADGVEQRREERRVVVGDGALHHRA